MFKLKSLTIFRENVSITFILIKALGINRFKISVIINKFETVYDSIGYFVLKKGFK